MNTYFTRYAYPKTLFEDKPDESLCINVVIPCFNEPDILIPLNSLKKCNPVKGVEIIIIVNEPEDCEFKVKLQNQKTLEDIDQWRAHSDFKFNLLVYHLILPLKDAGVGLARKAGMDEATRRFEQINNPSGVICCFDADATCEPNYLQSVYNHFVDPDVKPHGASVYFEHNIEGPQMEMNNGIIQYELHLRYYSHALAYTQFPYPHQTVGSSMIVRSDIYQKIGGMNKRKAGEDFYFLHRLMPSGNYIDINDTVIYPSARISNRVPFGTGKAMQKWADDRPDDYMTYNFQSFDDLKQLFKLRQVFYKVDTRDAQKLISSLTDSIQVFLREENFIDVLLRLNKQSSSITTFEKNWFQYFDGFKILKYLHYSRDNHHPNKPVVREAKILAGRQSLQRDIDFKSSKELLIYYRDQDRLN